MSAMRRVLGGHGLLWLGLGLLAVSLVLAVATTLYGSRTVGFSGPGGGGVFGGGPGSDLNNGLSDAGAGGVSMPEAREAAERAVDSYGNSDLRVTEVMEFANNYYAQVEESDTDRHAMELLIDKRTGEVSPEQGPNMMWNARYGMMGDGGTGSGMMNGGSQQPSGDQMPVGPEEAKQIASDYLDRASPGTTAVEPDAFYGYYTLHSEQDSEITGMLSVNGYSGEVWYHNWHGPFVAMDEGEDSH